LPTIHDTAYPGLKSSVSEKELNEIYPPTADEFDLVHSLTHSTAMRIGFLVLLKTFQRLGYFIPVHKVPRPIAEHISLIYGVHYFESATAADRLSTADPRILNRLDRAHAGIIKIREVENSEPNRCHTRSSSTLSLSIHPSVLPWS
jgi:Domain of unknown function (DUF4158)